METSVSNKKPLNHSRGITKQHLDLTIAIPVKNEENNLPYCLRAIGTDFAKNVVIIDSNSTDRTCEIAKHYGAEIINFEWNGKFPKKRNWYMRHHKPDTKWILFLDADECIGEDFKEEIRMALQSSEKIGYWLNYTIYFLGKQLKGGYPLKKLALFCVNSGEYEQVDDDHWSHMDMEIHEHPILKGEVGVIKSKIDHRDFQNVSHYVMKHVEYSSWEAARYMKKSDVNSKWTWKQHLKYTLARTVFIGPLYFCGSYFLMGGFRDGSRGLAFALLKMSYFTQVYCKILEAKSNNKGLIRNGTCKA